MTNGRSAATISAFVGSILLTRQVWRVRSMVGLLEVYGLRSVEWLADYRLTVSADQVTVLGTITTIVVSGRHSAADRGFTGVPGEGERAPWRATDVGSA